VVSHPNAVYEHIHSKQANRLLEVAMDYRTQIPEDKFDDVLRSIREVFSLPDDAHPKWYLEIGIVGKAPDEYRLPSESHISSAI
jgi:hypothetical protein